MSRSLILVLIAGLAACAGPDADAGAERARRIVMVTHGQAADPFWAVVSNGARDAADALGVRFEYQAPTRFDMVAMSNLIDAAVASRPDALVVSIPDAAALGASIRAAVSAGIPVVSINSGDDAWRALGVLAHVGQTEYEAGRGAGERLAAAGARRVLCANHEVGNAALDERCRGLDDALRAAGGETRVLAVDLADPDGTQQRIASALASDADIDAVLTLGPAAAAPALAAIAQSGRSSDVAYATFDLTPEVLAAIRDGAALFAVDQQQYLQGWLAVALLAVHLDTGAMPGGGDVIRTGPGFVTRETAASVIEASRRGVR